MTTYQAGDVLRLSTELLDLPMGAYVVLCIVDATAMLCAAGEDDAGDVCTTDRLYQVNVYHLAAAFSMTKVRLDDVEARQ